MVIFAHQSRTMKTLSHKIFLPALITLMLFSCGSGRVYEEYKKLPDYSWSRFENIIFETEIEDADANYNIYIAIRHITQYPFKNLLVTTIMQTPSGEQRLLEYDLKLRDDNGKPLGNGMGELWDINIPLRKNFKFNEAGPLIIEFENRMPQPQTPGIMEIGLIIEKI